MNSLTDLQREVLDLHTNPRHGSPYWIERASDCCPGRIETHEDLCEAFGTMDEEALRRRPLRDFIPAALNDRASEFVLGETGGATGASKRTAYLREEFEQAFVEPFRLAAEHVGFPAGARWLWVGPSGPHIIGKAAPRVAEVVGSPDPFSVDFDPRWFRKLPPDSLARERYLEHVLEQAMAVLNREDIGVLFTTPAVLGELAGKMTDAQRERIVGVHYGGQRIETQRLEAFQTEAFPNAVHLSGYGNTLFGCCLELDVSPGRTPEYFPHGDRLVFHFQADGEQQVRFSRFDRGFLIVNMAERDVADAAERPPAAPEGFGARGVRDPRPPAHPDKVLDHGLY